MARRGEQRDAARTDASSWTTIASDHTLTVALARHGEVPWYAIDTEFTAGATYHPVLELVQLRLDDEILLIDPQAVNLRLLAPVLQSPAVMFAHGSGMDRQLLARHCGARPAALFDTQIAAMFLGLATPSLAATVHALLDIELDKSVQRTDWAVRPMSPAAAAYAAADVAHLPALYAALSGMLERAGKVDLCRAECDEQRLLPASVPADAWMHVRGIRSMTIAEVTRVQAIATWREGEAHRRDRARSRILTDAAVCALARHPERNASVLGKTPDFAHLRRRELREVLAARDAAPVEDGPVLPLLQPRRRWTPLEELLYATLRGAAARSAIDPMLICSRLDIYYYLQNRDSRLSAGWRRERILPILRGLATGELHACGDPRDHSVRIQGREGEVLLVASPPNSPEAHTPTFHELARLQRAVQDDDARAEGNARPTY